MVEIIKPAAQEAKVDKSVRPKRTPLGMANRLTFKGLNPAYNYRVINDKDGRLQRAIDGGYEFVESTEELGDVRVADATKIGSKVSKPVGHGITGYLMRIKREWYDEDQSKKQERVDEIERSMKPAKAKEEYGPGLTNE
jgi:hypothetical protein